MRERLRDTLFNGWLCPQMIQLSFDLIMGHSSNKDHPMPPFIRIVLLMLLSVSLCVLSTAAADDADEGLREVHQCHARDTFHFAPEHDEADWTDAEQCVSQFAWEPVEFEVSWEATPERDYDRLVRFPSPLPSGDAVNDLVSMEWYLPREGVEPTASILVIHESGSGMTVGRMIADGLRIRGFHVFMIHLPYYGERRGGGRRPDEAHLIQTMRQGIADVRRARDAIASIPDLPGHIAIQGTSLGGFVTTTAASLDTCFDSVFIFLAGADLYSMLQSGQQDTAKLRERLAEAGFTDDRLRELLWHSEPSRTAGRLNPSRTWQFTAAYDDVVPLANALRLCEAANLPEGHHIQFPGGHYTSIIYLPAVLDHIEQQINELVESE